MVEEPPEPTITVAIDSYPKGVIGVAELLALDAGEVPALFVAVTVNV